jgi:hypothetical protein
MSRPKGSLNKRTRQALHAAKEGELWAGTTPLDFLRKIMQDPEKPESLRIEAAKAAAPYVHPRLSNVEVSAKQETWTSLLASLPKASPKEAETKP